MRTNVQLPPEQDADRYGLALTNRGQISDRPTFPSQSSVLDERALFDRVVPVYDIPSPVSCVFYERGDSDIYLVRTSGPTYFLKVYRPPNTLAQAEGEARFVADLADRGVPVVLAVPRQDGAYATRIGASEGPRPALLFEAAPQGKLEELSPGDSRALGKAIARLHAAADRCGDYALPVNNVEHLGQDLYPYAKRLMSDEDRTEIAALFDILRERLRALPTSRPDYGLCHSDLVFGNIRRQADGAFVFFDFGNASYDWRGRELAVLRQSLLQRVQGDAAEETWSALLAGYSQVRALPAGLPDQLPVFELLRKASWVCGVMASCPLRMGTEGFNQAWVRGQMPVLRELASRL